jgi:hypothetical protein
MSELLWLILRRRSASFRFHSGIILIWTGLPWREEFFLAGGRDLNALKWFGTPCRFGQTYAHLVDEAGQLSPPLLLAGKFVESPVIPQGENWVILGAHALARPGLSLNLHVGNPRQVNNLTNVIGQFTIT